MNDTTYTCIHVPMKCKDNITPLINRLDVSGSSNTSIKEAIENEKPLTFTFRPSDPYSHSITSTKPRNVVRYVFTIDKSSLKVKNISKCDKKITFESLADFQYMAPPAYHNKNDNVPWTSTAVNAPKLCLVPFQFSKYSTPRKYDFKSKAQESVTSETKSSERPIIFMADADDDNLQMMDRYELQTSGPWKNCFIRKDYDPQADSSAFQYQVIAIENSIKNTSNNIQFKSVATDAEISFSLYELLHTNGTSDFRNIPFNMILSQYSPVTGWLSQEYILECKRLLRVHLELENTSESDDNFITI